jgi:hypothetical protein
MAERYIPEHRRTQFKAKNTFKPDELRRRREEQQVEIRRQKREENLAKRRGIQRGDGQIGIGGLASADSDDEGGTIESEVCEILRYEPERLLMSLLVAQHRIARDGEGSLFGSDRRSDSGYYKVPEAPVKGAKPSYRASNRDWCRQPLCRIPTVTSHTRPI